MTPLITIPATTVFVEPGNGSRYQLYAVRLPGKPNQLLYSFGLGDYPMATYAVTLGIEPDDFGYFCEKWNSRGAEGNAVDLWAGLMFLRHILGYPTEFAHLPLQLQLEARSYTYEVIEASGARAQEEFLPEQVGGWRPGWRTQLAAFAVIHRAEG